MTAMTEPTGPQEPTAPPETTTQPALPEPKATKPGRRQIVATGVAVLLVVVAVGGWLVVQHKSASMTVDGVMTVAADPTTTVDALNAGHAGAGDACQLSDGYEDLVGAQVAITDDSGHTLGLGALSSPVFTIAVKSGEPGICSLPFSVSGVSKTKTVYTVTVGRRGSVKFTRKQMEDGPVLDIQ